MPISILSISSDAASLQALLNPSFIEEITKKCRKILERLGDPRLPSRLPQAWGGGRAAAESIRIPQLENSQWPRVIPLNLLFRARHRGGDPSPTEIQGGFLRAGCVLIVCPGFFLGVREIWGGWECSILMKTPPMTQSRCFFSHQHFPLTIQPATQKQGWFPFPSHPQTDISVFYRWDCLNSSL